MTAIKALRSRWLLPVLTLCTALQLVACGDSEEDQRKAFITVLKNVPAQPGSALPVLSEDQKKTLGPHVNDYAILTTYSAQLRQGAAASLAPLLEEISHLRVPQDYLTQRDALRRSASALNLLGEQVQTVKTQAETARKALKQNEELQVLYNRVYSQVVMQPAKALESVVPVATMFAQQLVQVGDYLQAQGNQVSFNGNRVQFDTAQQVASYNALVAPLTVQYQSLISGLQAQAPLLNP